MWRFSHAVVARSSDEARVWTKRVPSSLKRAWARDLDTGDELDFECCFVAGCSRRNGLLQSRKEDFLFFIFDLSLLKTIYC